MGTDTRHKYWSIILNTEHPYTVNMMSIVLKLNIWLHNLYTSKSLNPGQNTVATYIKILTKDTYY